MSIAEPLAHSTTKRPLSYYFETVTFSMLIFVYVLIPLDWGAPGIPIAGHQIAISVTLSLMALVAYAYTSRGKIFRYFLHPFSKWQLVSFAFLTASSQISTEPLVAFQEVLKYYIGFGVNFVLVLYLVERHGTRWFINTILVSCVISACIGVADTLGGFRIPIYQKMQEIAQSENATEVVDLVRGIGTQGFPIFEATLLMLAIPYVFSVRSSTLRVLLLGILAMGMAITVSRTAALGIFVYTIGAAIIYPRKFLIIVGVLTAVLGGVLISGAADKLLDSPLVILWAARAGIGSSASAGTAESNNERTDSVTLAFHRINSVWGPEEFLLGEGSFSTPAIAEGAGLETIDNAAVTILFDHGAVAVFLFYGAFVFMLWRTRKYARLSLHWYNAIALLSCGLSFGIERFTTFNLLAMGSLAIVSLPIPVLQTQIEPPALDQSASPVLAV